MPAFTVTLTSSATTYHLYDLIRAIDANFVDGGRTVSVQVASDAGAAKVRVGNDSAVSASRTGKELTAEGGYILQGGENRHFIRGVYAKSDTNGTKLHIDVER